jgi:glycosyltransferase involved in cell wall biosynthesis
MKKYNVGILADQFINWGGGVDFIRLILNGLSAINETGSKEICIHVFVPKQSDFRINIKNGLKILLNNFFKKKFLLQTLINEKLFVDTFKSVNDKIEIYYYNRKESDLAKMAIKYDIDFLFPAFDSLSPNFPVAWAGYIYDFQHKYYPGFFTEKAIKNRDRQFLSLLNQAKIIIVNAKSVKNDIEKFIGKSNATVITLPFCPVLNLDLFKLEINLEKYKLPQKYFMISNQFWKHKDHATAFHAFRNFLDESENKDIYLVCTGHTQDNRFPNYFNSLQDLILDLNLESKIYILGYIPKSDQLQILKNSLAIIQPTLFEGGPGGGAILESVAYGVPSIVSDIPVNKEIDDETVIFFKSGSPEDLAKKMRIIAINKKKEYSVQELIEKNNKSLLKLGNVLLSTLPNKLTL